MLPGCMSAWKKPSRNTWVKKMVTPSRASCRMSTPASRRRSIWLIGTPFMRSITITSGWQKSQSISGISTRSRPAMLRRSCAALAASRTRSSSSCRYLSNSATTSRGFRRLPSADRPSTQPAIMRISARSFSITGSMPGRSTFTATSRVRPCRSCSVAKCTWAIEALATGSRSKLRRWRPTGRRKARSMVAMATAESNGGTRSCSRASSSAMSARQQVAPGRQHLAELDEDRAEPLQRLAQALAARRVEVAAERQHARQPVQPGRWKL